MKPVAKKQKPSMAASGDNKPSCASAGSGYEEIEVARAATDCDACPADDGGVKILAGDRRGAAAAPKAKTAVHKSELEMVQITLLELNQRLLKAFQEGIQKGQQFYLELNAATAPTLNSDEEEQQECDDDESDEDGDEAEEEDYEEDGEAEAEVDDEGEEAEAEGDDEDGEAEAEGYNEDGEAESEGYDEDAEAEAEGYDEDAEAEAEGYDEDGEAEVADEAEAEASVVDESKGASSLAATSALANAMASAQKRRVLCQLGDFLTAMVDQQTRPEAEQQQPPAVASRFQASDQESPAGRALHWLNRLRLRHSGCRPLARSDPSSVFAANLADDFVYREDMCGLTPDLKQELNASSMPVETFEAQGRECGVLVYRTRAPAECELQALAFSSIKYWYNGCESFDFDSQQESMSQLRCRQFAQLIDTNSQRVGWGGAVCNGCAYAVAIFDNPIVQDDEAVKRLSAPIPGVNPFVH